ncbi:MAG: alpha/beta hydrolase [Chlamydiales bacterium]
MIDYRWCIFPAKDTPTSCILILPGRSQHGIELARAWLKSELQDTLFIAVTPIEKQWYPMPYSAINQDDAIAGLEIARAAIEEVLTIIEEKFHIPRNKIGIVGFSAGGVMSIYVASHSEREMAGVVCHAGAILEPEKLPLCRYPQMPIILTHCQDDNVFDWYERYVPMADALDKQNYNLYVSENEWGGHGLDLDDVLTSAKVLGKRLGYTEEWFRQQEDLYI